MEFADPPCVGIEVGLEAGAAVGEADAEEVGAFVHGERQLAADHVG